MRDLNDILDLIINEVPDGEELLATLKDIKSSVMTAAPEMMPFWWREVAVELEDATFPPKVNWHHRVADIFCRDVYQRELE